MNPSSITFLTSKAFAITLVAASLASLQGCGKPRAAAAPEIPSPIIVNEQIRFPAGHPSLAMLGSVEAKGGKAIPVDFPARVVWNEERTQRIFPALSGRVTEIRADVSQGVARGDVLAQLASPDLGQAQADESKARSDLAFAKKTLARQKNLLDAGIVARKDYEQAEADTARAKAEYTRASSRANLYGNAGQINQKLAIRSSMGGVVVERNLNPGQELRPEQYGPSTPALFVITDPTSMWVQIDVREAEIDTLAVGSTFELSLPALKDKRFTGKVIATADLIDPATRTLKVRGLIANPDRTLKAEMLGMVRIERQLGKGVAVPNTAVLLRENKHVVFVESEPGVYAARNVTLSYEGPKEVLVGSGLEVGDKVVANNALLLARQLKIAMEEAHVGKKAEGSKEGSK